MAQMAQIYQPEPFLSTRMVQIRLLVIFLGDETKFGNQLKVSDNKTLLIIQKKHQFLRY